MSGVMPPLPIYDFVAWTGTILLSEKAKIPQSRNFIEPEV
jgi:hypothetical protein